MANDPITQRGSLHTRTEAALPCAGRALWRSSERSCIARRAERNTKKLKLKSSDKSLEVTCKSTGFTVCSFQTFGSSLHNLCY